MASVTGWTRIEPRPRSRDFDGALQARVRDPLWFLARQWQVGEFDGEDAGTVMSARLDMDVAPVNRYRAGADGTAQPYDAGEVPLETLVEREPRVAPNLRDRAESGLYFSKLLHAQSPGLDARYRNAYVKRYPLPAADGDSRSSRLFMTVMRQRAADGAALAEDLRAPLSAEPPTLPAAPAIEPGDMSQVIAAARAWLAWYDETFDDKASADTVSDDTAPHEDAWIADRFEYQFEVSAPTVDADDAGAGGEMVLAAAEYYRGRLDWYDFDIRRGARLGGPAGPGAPSTFRQTVIPMPVEFDGMPAPRWWEFEDGRFDFGRIDAAPDDLARLLLLEFALVYGNDWLMFPVELSVGTLSHIRSLVVTDTFGQQSSIPPSAQPTNSAASWGMYYLAGSGRSLTERQEPAAEVFFLPPTLATNIESAPIEEVLLIRDEMANMAWGIERTIEGSDGRPVDRFEAYQATLPEQPPTEREVAEGGPVEYRLASTIPDHWIPLLPVHVGDGQRGIALQRGAMLDPESGTPILARGTLLTPTQRLVIDDEEVQRIGARVTRTRQYTRWTNGATLSWVGKRKLPGRGEGSSGLRFDSISEALERE
jgi:hypothetical protein